MGMLEDSMLYSLNSEVDELKEKLRKANLRIKELEEGQQTEIYKNLSRKYSNNIINCLLHLKGHKTYLNDITSNKEYNNNKLCEDCDMNKNTNYDIEKITKNYCPFAPICEIENGEEFNIDKIIKILEENDK